MAKAPSKKDRRPPQEMHLNITSLIDVLTILLVFLLKSYSTEPEGNITMSDVIELPTTVSQQRVEEQSTSITITKNAILLDNKKEVATIGADWQVSDPDADNPFRIQALIDSLNEVAEQQEFIAQNNPNFRFQGELLIQADRDMPSRVLAAVLFSVGQAGFDKIRLIAIDKHG